MDIAIYRDREPIDPVPAEPPLVAVEIVSPGDRYEELRSKLIEYQQLGVPHIWIIDPGLRTISVFEGRSLMDVDVLELPEFELRFTAAQLFGPPTKLVTP